MVMSEKVDPIPIPIRPSFPHQFGLVRKHQKLGAHFFDFFFASDSFIILVTQNGKYIYTTYCLGNSMGPISDIYYAPLTCCNISWDFEFLVEVTGTVSQNHTWPQIQLHTS